MGGGFPHRGRGSQREQPRHADADTGGNGPTHGLGPRGSTIGEVFGWRNISEPVPHDHQYSASKYRGKRAGSVGHRFPSQGFRRAHPNRVPEGCTRKLPDLSVEASLSSARSASGTRFGGHRTHDRRGEGCAMVFRPGWPHRCPRTLEGLVGARRWTAMSSGESGGHTRSEIDTTGAGSAVAISSSTHTRAPHIPRGRAVSGHVQSGLHSG